MALIGKLAWTAIYLLKGQKKWIKDRSPPQELEEGCIAGWTFKYKINIGILKTKTSFKYISFPLIYFMTFEKICNLIPLIDQSNTDQEFKSVDGFFRITEVSNIRHEDFRPPFVLRSSL